jgi:hypothetical protein
MPKFGPGTLTFGAAGSELDVSCNVNSLTIETTKDQGDSRTMLCGTVKPGSITYEYAMNGNLDIDSELSDGFFAFSQANAGEQVPFVFVPNTPSETSASGVVVIDPLSFGGDEYGADMASDIAFTLVGRPEYTYPETPPAGFAASTLATHGNRKVGTVTDETAAALAKLRKKTGTAEPTKESVSA